MYCSKCGKEREGSAAECGCGAAYGGLPPSNSKALCVFNACLLIFTAVLTVVSLITFFMATNTNNLDSAYIIAATYVLCMLLAIPSLKVFLDKVSRPLFNKLNLVFIVLGFAAILVLVVVLFVVVVL